MNPSMDYYDIRLGVDRDIIMAGIAPQILEFQTQT